MRLAAAVAFCAALLAAPVFNPAAFAQTTADAIAADPPADAAHPARLEVIHVPSGGVNINGIVYVAAGAGPHPTFVLFHGLPGNERNLDLAQAVRRAGWNVVAVNYRGSWGSPGAFSFAQNLQDADAVLAFVRDPANAKALQIDTARLAIGGHSMGGWVTVQTLAHDTGVLGAVTISAGDMGGLGQLSRADHAAAVKLMAENRESLNATAEAMADEVAAHAGEWSFATLAPKLKDRRLYVLYSDDFVKSNSEALVAGIRAAGGTRVTSRNVPTDHSWSDHRIALETLVIDWLKSLPTTP
ncbi:MAG TPA: alpha/beta fold hydrolase [Caulobacteraceae bacterium]